MIYVLILMMHVGPLGNGNSNALTTAEFSSLTNCNEAGQKAMSMAQGTVKEIKYVCSKK